MSLQVEILERDKVFVVRLKGELDHHTANDLRQTLGEKIERHGFTHLILNLRDLTFMDSSGLGVLMGRYKQISAKKGEMFVCSMNPTIYRILELAGLFKILTVKETEEEVLASLGVTL
ncbi:anti-sigma F factor antagonist [Thermicanus aegyptius]|uniref:anti-sigma F factor antagonist n=1 Tax=Thermicanus aegyptius TaxID=94009 RepID=UPI00048B6093|nr:anti-sigma F factor antagonist [Thermicanus aegyptius]